jgi:stage V sporulation protein D (sporulation-specific penicillin-binding protein)
MTRNKVITDIYEPGSTFKVVTLASALDSGKVSVDSEFDCAGSYPVDGHPIKCWRYPNSHGHQTLREAVQNSCNVAFMKMGLAMETETFYDYIYKFGFGQETGITFPSDSGGIVMAEKYVRNSDLARIAFGQSIAVTPLQLISSFCAVVNGGFLYEPMIVKGIQDSDGDYIDEYQPTVISQPIKAETSAIVCDILESVVSEGSGKNCYIPGYRVGGKTGTAQKYNEDGSIMSGKHIASFIGFAPVDDPKIAVLIVVDEPNVAVDFGSIVAAPYVKDVIYESLQYMGVMPDEGAEAPEQVPLPDVVGMTADDAASALQAVGIKWLMDGTGTVEEQMPAPETVVDSGTTVMLSMTDKTEYDETDGMVVVPDVSGMSIMDAGQLLEDNRLEMSIEGQGNATYQSPQEGEIVPEGTTVQVEFSAPDG